MMGTPKTPLNKIDRGISSTPGGSRVKEEKILVTVRMRPLNGRELSKYDLIAWECPDDQTILYKNPNPERPAARYSFDKVFEPTCSTLKVYEGGARDVALSALTGTNATIFAYGQTSSGKTFTMKGITENVVKDMYEHIRKTEERSFVLKLSALEIYNETVIDLLNNDTGPLRLLDDPEKGTMVENLVEEVIENGQHLKHLISICEAHRQVGETALNDKSSRSHQIIRLTIESSLREKEGRVKSFLATLNLVDLAGSERATQTNAAGIRLKEGSHINRSLLTLTTVIRKLSSGRRSDHVPYRDSKLTRILQNSLGGNARTAIICTVSPALSHVEQTKKTFSFATSAKEVTNRTKVNMVVSDKTLLKHLQQKVAKLESELRSPEPSSSSCLKSLLLEKEMKIQQMEMEMRELKRQRDLVQSQLDLERKAKEPKSSNEHEPYSQVARCLTFPTQQENVSSKSVRTIRRMNLDERKQNLRQSITSTDPVTLVQEIRLLEKHQRKLGEEASQALELIHKEVTSHRMGDQQAAEKIAKMLSEIRDMQKISLVSDEIVVGDKANLKEEISRLNSQEIASLEKKLESVQKSIDMLVSSFQTDEQTPEFGTQMKKKKVLPFGLSNSPNIQHIIRAPCSPLSSSRRTTGYDTENKAPESSDVSANSAPIVFRSTPPKRDDSQSRTPSREGTPIARQANSVDVKKMKRMFKNAAEENIRNIKAYVTGLKERVAKLQYQKQLLVCQVLELEANEATAALESDAMEESQVPWPLCFEEQRKQIIMLWHLCHISIIHRTQFYLLFKGEETDQIYMDVELRRLTWLEQHLAELGNASPALLSDEPASYVASSVRALKQEREYLAKRVNSKLTAEEREALYMKWEVPPVGKQRRNQFINKLWTNPHDMEHVKESAQVVAKLVGFCDAGENVVRKEMFELNFASPLDKKTGMGWNFISNLLHL
ncbi:PREDICTED: kinesin-like protein KIN-7B isoform X2 [Tarenaya hassleriana]|nr:PREDICTED: kinesin-like protein KIN-7B isoform X2 [Tarenaya hassleriana]XP_010535795.1 PREDICTED: kinesin-like protein KIN-7B isoform X2 [Tarenaya hassleriana]